jgi:hypothetical protein
LLQAIELADSMQLDQIAGGAAAAGVTFGRT